MKRMTYAEWKAEGTRRFGKDMTQWRFVCPSCGVTTAVHEWLAVNEREAIAFNCIGRATGSKQTILPRPPAQGPCNYTGGGLFKLNPVEVVMEDGHTMSVFEFAADA